MHLATVYPVGTPTEPGLSTDRVTRYRFDLLDRTEQLVGEVRSVQPAGQVSWSAQASVKGSGSITVTDIGQHIDWLNCRIRPTLIVEDLHTGRRQEYPVGVFLCAAPVEDWSATGREWTVELVDKNSILDTDIVTDDGRPTTFTLPAGANIVAAVVALIRSTGETTPAIGPDDKVLAFAQTWDTGTTLLKIVNDLLETANYYSLWCDEQGQYRLTACASCDRTPVYDLDSPFTTGTLSRMSPDWGRDRDLYSVPNRFVLVGQGSDEEPAWVATAINNNPTSEFSFQRRGRWVTYVETEVEAVSQAALQSSAERRLLLATSVSNTMTVKHLFLPNMRVNNVVRFVNDDAGLNILCTVANTSVEFNPTGLASSTLREVKQ